MFRPHLEQLEDRLVPSTMAGTFVYGVYRYDTSTGWSHISPRRALALDVDDAGDVYAKFTDGLWRWSAATSSWAQLSGLAVDTFKVTASGVLYGDFGSQGVWRWDPSNNGWRKLSDLDASSIAVSDSDAFFASFNTPGAQGVWRWTPGAGWSWLTISRPSRLLTDAAGDMILAFQSNLVPSLAGTWRWNPTLGWARLSTSAPYFIAVSANGAIFENRVTDGMWYAAPGAGSFTRIGTAAADDVMCALPDGSLYIDRFDTASNRHRGYYWNAALPPVLGYIILIDNSNNSSDPVIGKDGDLFFEATDGIAYWSRLTPCQTLSGNDLPPHFIASQR
jgi:hypothetical protein